MLNNSLQCWTFQCTIYIYQYTYRETQEEMVMMVYQELLERKDHKEILGLQDLEEHL